MTTYSREEFKEECDRRRTENLIVKGKTFDIKDQIKDLGGIWDSREKQWLMPDQGTVAACHAAMGLGDGPPTESAPDKAAEAEDLEGESGEMPF